MTLRKPPGNMPEKEKRRGVAVVVIAHSGLLPIRTVTAWRKTRLYYLSEVPGVDAIMFCHGLCRLPR